MSEITPTTEQLRMAWIKHRWDQAGQLRSEGSDAEFDRWLARVKAEAWEEGRTFTAQRATSIPAIVLEYPNPYRVSDAG